MFRKSHDTTRSDRTTASSLTGSPRGATALPGGKGTPKNRGGILRRLHPDLTNEALEAKINSPRVSGKEAKEAQAELRDRNITPPKRSMSTRIARLRNKWTSSGTTTSKSTPQTY